MTLCEAPLDMCDATTKPPLPSTAKFSTTVPFWSRKTVSPKRIVSSRAYAVARVAGAVARGGAVVADRPGTVADEVVSGLVEGAGVGAELLGGLLLDDGPLADVPLADGSEVVAVVRAGAGAVP